MPTTPPHLARPELTYVEPGGWDAYFQAVALGFHEPWHEDTDGIEEKVAETDRFFGFQVDGTWIATCGAFSRTMTVPGGAEIPSAAVTVVTVAPSYRRRGLLTQMMRHQLEDVSRRKEPVAILWASESLIYGRFGYGFSAPRAAISGSTRSTAYLPAVPVADGSVAEVPKAEFLAAAPPVHDRLRPQRVGGLDRRGAWWEWLTRDPEWARGGLSERRYALHFGRDGDVDGYAMFRIKEEWDSVTGPNATVVVAEADATSPAAYAATWRFLLDLDLVRQFSRRNAPVDDRLRYMVADPRAIQTQVSDGIYVRIVHPVAALEARRYATDLDVVLDLTDALLPANTGRYRMQVTDGAASVTKARRKPDVSLAVRELGSAYLGGTSFGDLHAAGLVTEHTDGAVAALSTAFGWITRPFCPDPF